MGVYKFRWYCPSTLCTQRKQTANAPLHRRNQPATKVVVTGSFDDWSKSESLDKVDDGFEKTVHIDNDSEKVYYKVSGFPLLGALCTFGCSYSACLIAGDQGTARNEARSCQASLGRRARPTY